MGRGALRGVLTAALCAALFLCTAAAAQAAQRYASPSGTGTACTSASPCPIKTAFTSAPSGTEIVLTPGDYNDVDKFLFVPQNGSVHGVAGQPMPRIHFAPTYYISTGNNRLSYVSVDAPTSQPLEVDLNGLADQVYAHSTGGSACISYGTLISSVCWTSSSGAPAIEGAISGGSTSATLRNVTAEATAPGGVGIAYSAIGSGHFNTTMDNVIAHGTSADLQPNATLPSTTTFTVDHSNYANPSPVGSGADIVPTATQSQPPLFTNAAAGDFSEAPGSPTIDGGLTSSLNGSFDILGKPRTINGLTDIGAYEFDPFSGVALRNQHTRVKKRKGSVAVGCPAGTPASCDGSLTLTFGRKTAGSTSFSIPTGVVRFLKVKVSKKTLKKVRKMGKLATTATATATDGAGTKATATARVKLKV